MASANLDGTDYLFASYTGSQAFMIQYTDGSTNSSNELAFEGLTYDTGGGSNVSPERQGFGDKTNNQIVTSMLGGKDYMYIGIKNTNLGGKVYLGTTLAGGTPALNFSGTDGKDAVFNSGGDPNVGGTQASAMEIFSCSGTDTLFLGLAHSSGPKMYKTTQIGVKPATFNSVDLSSLSNDNVDVTALKATVDGTTLYLATENSKGAQVWKTTDCTTFSKVVDFADGTGLTAADTANTRVNFLEANGTTKKYLYFGTEKSSGGFEVWRSASNDTSAFTQVGVDDSTCKDEGAADSFGSADVFINARNSISVKSKNRLFISVQEGANATSGGTKVYRVDDD